MNILINNGYIDMKSKSLLGTILVILVIIGVLIIFLRFVIGGSEDSWICVDGQWVKHGVPSALKPQNGCE